MEADMLSQVEPAKRKHIRCTIHCRDLLYDRHLYQLLDYYPKGEGRGRAFSERYDIIGKVWRSGLAQVVPNLLPGSDQQFSEEDKIDIITRDWGMSRREARHALEKPSYACCLITHETRKVGILYMDSTDEAAFPAEVKQTVNGQQKQTRFEHYLARCVENKGFGENLEEVEKEMRQYPLAVDIS